MVKRVIDTALLEYEKGRRNEDKVGILGRIKKFLKVKKIIKIPDTVALTAFSGKLIFYKEALPPLLKREL